MTETKDLSLLRPLTLDDIKPGTKVTWLRGGKEVAWVEGKPVYPGDVLYHGKTQYIASSSAFEPNEYLGGGMSYKNLTWTPPKTTHRAWLNLYPDGNAFAYDDEITANSHAGSDRSECRMIEWES